MGQNFDKVYVKAQNIISDWKSRKLPINGRITISKCLIVSQFNYVASIIKHSNRQIQKSQNMINSCIRDSDRHWVSDQKLYAPTNKGGLNCIELKTFFMALQMNWFKRYMNYKYDDYWTLSLDRVFNVNPTNRISILRWGCEDCTQFIE